MNDEYITLTREHLELFRTRKNGLTGLTMQILTGTNKPKSGWFTNSLGKVISMKDFHQILQDVERVNFGKPHSKMVQNDPEQMSLF